MPATAVENTTATKPPNQPTLLPEMAHNDVRVGGIFDGPIKRSTTPSGVDAASFWIRTSSAPNATRIKVNLYKDISALEKLTPGCFLSVRGELMNRAWKGTFFLEVRAKHIDVQTQQPSQQETAPAHQ